MSQTATIKITSKHQLTVPAQAVRQLHLSAGDFLHYELRGNTLILKPRPSVGQRLQTVWQQNAKTNRGVASDASIKQTLGTYHRTNSPEK